MNEEEKHAVDSLRNECKELLSTQFGTEFNLLRWAQGYGFDIDEASEELTRHLKFRRFYDLDNAEKIKEHEILKKYFPIGLVGETGVDNNLLVIECAGRIDLMGILKSVHLSDFLIQRYRFQEKMLMAMNELEKRSGKQAAVIYILDLEGLKFDPCLLSIVTGPYRILWASVYTNYPEWIDKMFVINAPSFMTILWKAIGPLLPERTRNKVRIFGTHDWQSVIQKHALPKNIPKHWGGTLVDANGDAMCRDRLNIPFDPIPQSLYWNPSKETPAADDMTTTVVPAGKAKIITYVVPHQDQDIFLVVNRFCDRTFGMGIWYHENEAAVDFDLSEMMEWYPDFDYPGMPTTDYMRIKAPGPGVYKMKLGNESAWIRSLTVSHRIRFQSEDKMDFSISTLYN
ncbi:unnamed protein product [Auanema sp. JU1783]|nr:unnamed protein product [Auanema sp. JU1783]